MPGLFINRVENPCISDVSAASGAAVLFFFCYSGRSAADSDTTSSSADTDTVLPAEGDAR